jgi:hypothetical protein
MHLDQFDKDFIVMIGVLLAFAAIAFFQRGKNQ